MMRLQQLLASALVALCSITAVHAADNYPSKPISILVGTGPGGNPDAIARAFQNYVARNKQIVVVENRTGAGGAIALKNLVQAPPDGYTLMSGASATQGLFTRDPGFRFEDLVPASVIGVSSYGLLVGKGTNFNTLNDLVAYAKANPGKLNFGIIPSTSHEVEISNLLKMLDIDAAIIPYKGMPEIYNALISGELQATIHSNSPFVKSGQVRALAFGSESRLPDAPNVPTFKELGFDYHPGASFIFYARVGTPREVLTKISSQVAEMVKTPEFDERIAKPLGITGLGLSVDASAKYVNDEYERVKAGVQRLKITPQ